MAGKFELKRGKDGKFLFNLQANNGQVVLTSQMYKAKESALAGIESVRKNAVSDSQYERKTSSNDEPFFVLTATNGQVIGNSQMYSSPAAMEKGIESVKTNAPDAELVDVTGVQV